MESDNVAGTYFAVIVSDVEESADWYRAALGLEVQSRMREEGSYDIVNLMAPGTRDCCRIT